MNKPNWFVTRNFLDYKNHNQSRITDEVKDQWHKFRLYDDDGELYFEGWSNNDSSFAPLNWALNNYGCTEIKYLNKGRWSTL